MARSSRLSQGLASPAPVAIDFTVGALAHRLRSGAGRGGGLARAIGIGREDPPAVVDATAGLGRDGFLLASLGCAVTMIERVPAVHAALAEGLAAAALAGGVIGQAAGRVLLLAGDARLLLPQLRPPIVLIDPMHPGRDKAALVKQPLRALRDLVGADEDAAALMEVALRCAGRRLVLKWPLRAALPAGLRAPSHSIKGQTTRFDVFILEAQRLQAPGGLAM